MHDALVVDTHRLFREYFVQHLQGLHGIDRVHQADSGEEALTCVRNNAPRLVFLDLIMRGMGGIEATMRILAHAPETAVIVVTGYTHRLYLRGALDAGAMGYVSKESSRQEVEKAIRKVQSGRRGIDESLIDLALPPPSGRGNPAGDPFSALTGRELEVMNGVLHGRKKAQIADALKVSRKTVYSHCAQILRKTGVDSDVDLIRLAIRFGLIEDAAVA